MGPEINAHSIQILEKEIEKGIGDVIQLKRVRNSLLDISARVPPEILGSIFRWTAIPGEGYPDVCELRNVSYRFLLVCHHWFKVASHTPEFWSFWGNTLEQWSRRYQYSGTGPVDLMLSRYFDGDACTFSDGPLRDAVRDCAARDTIRSLYLRSNVENLVTDVLSSLTPTEKTFGPAASSRSAWITQTNRISSLVSVFPNCGISTSSVESTVHPGSASVCTPQL